MRYMCIVLAPVCCVAWNIHVRVGVGSQEIYMEVVHVHVIVLRVCDGLR